MKNLSRELLKRFYLNEKSIDIKNLNTTMKNAVDIVFSNV